MIIRLGILNCDILSDAVVANFGDYPRMFQRFFGGSQSEFSYQVYRVQDGEFPADIRENDVYLITGSKASAYRREPWMLNLEVFIRSVVEEEIPLMGFCFGHQIVAQALGGGVAKSDKGWGVGVRKMNVLKRCDWMQVPLREFSLLYSHQDQVVELPPGAVTFAGDAFCSCAGMMLGSRVLTFQGHPEFDKDYLRYLLGVRRSIIGEVETEQALRSLSKPLDKRPVRQWLEVFIAQALDSQSA